MLSRLLEVFVWSLWWVHWITIVSFVTDQSDNLSCWSFDTGLKTAIEWFSIMCRKTKIQNPKDKGQRQSTETMKTRNK